jgi:fatty acid desaturase
MTEAAHLIGLSQIATEAAYLTGLSQIALGLAGFTGVVMTFGYRPEGPDETYRMRLLLLLYSSIASIFLPLLPLGLNTLGVMPPELWRVASLILALCSSVIIILYFNRFRRLPSEERRKQVSIPLTIFLSLGTVVNIVVQFLNAMGVVVAVLGVFFFGLLWVLFVPALQFGRLVYVQFNQRQGSSDKPRDEEEQRVYIVALLSACITALAIILLAYVNGVFPSASDKLTWVAFYTAVFFAFYTAVFFAFDTISTTILAWRKVQRRDVQEAEPKIAQLEREAEAARESTAFPASEEQNR